MDQKLIYEIRIHAALMEAEAKSMKQEALRAYERAIRLHDHAKKLLGEFALMSNPENVIDTGINHEN